MMLDTNTIIRAWKNEHYRQSLSDSELAQLPANPVGTYDLLDEELTTTSDAPRTSDCTYNCD